ncbi:hypothetical protein HK097_008626 [Rhizophlyctis rosea]|uniref:Uncharacterized protein n=1 Tax=Rhizophlyctis rosea TaxID=64517 RepID=A0AAD5X1L1_9FUNG|nr:hypothetical protein HK097_008626 [Rhizophlyctis rosea]
MSDNRMQAPIRDKGKGPAGPSPQPPPLPKIPFPATFSSSSSSKPTPHHSSTPSSKTLDVVASLSKPLLQVVEENASLELLRPLPCTDSKTTTGTAETPQPEFYLFDERIHAQPTFEPTTKPQYHSQNQDGSDVLSFLHSSESSTVLSSLPTSPYHYAHHARPKPSLLHHTQISLAAQDIYTDSTTDGHEVLAFLRTTRYADLIASLDSYTTYLEDDFAKAQRGAEGVEVGGEGLNEALERAWELVGELDNRRKHVSNSDTNAGGVEGGEVKDWNGRQKAIERLKLIGSHIRPTHIASGS